MTDDPDLSSLEIPAFLKRQTTKEEIMTFPHPKQQADIDAAEEAREAAAKIAAGVNGTDAPANGEGEAQPTPEELIATIKKLSAKKEQIALDSATQQQAITETINGLKKQLKKIVGQL